MTIARNVKSFCLDGVSVIASRIASSLAPPKLSGQLIISLLNVFILAKILMLAGREIPISAWTPFAYLWQDV